MNSIRVVTWNIERKAPGRRQAQIMLERIEALSPDIVCLTEGFEESTASLGGFEISVRGVFWSREAPGERKVVLWSRQPWTAVDVDGNENLRCGAFAAATTTTSLGEIRVIGVCIPYSFASPAGLVPRHRPWSQHLRFLQGLQPVVAGREPGKPTIVLGDYNQFAPRIWGSKAASAGLADALGDLMICTTGLIEGVGRPAIDHIALSPDLTARSIRGIDEHDANGKKLSDHFGIEAVLEKAKS